MGGGLSFGCCFSGRDFRGCFLLAGCCAKKRIIGALQVGLTRRGGQRYAVGLPEVGRWL